MIRYFTVTRTSIGETGGRYASKSGPAAAAKKAASKRFGKSKSNQIRLTIRETGTADEFTYNAHRIKLDKPIVRKINGATITSKYRIEVKKAEGNTTVREGGMLFKQFFGTNSKNSIPENRDILENGEKCIYSIAQRENTFINRHDINEISDNITKDLTIIGHNMYDILGRISDELQEHKYEVIVTQNNNKVLQRDEKTICIKVEQDTLNAYLEIDEAFIIVIDNIIHHTFSRTDIYQLFKHEYQIDLVDKVVDRVVNKVVDIVNEQIKNGDVIRLRNNFFKTIFDLYLTLYNDLPMKT